MITRHWFNSSSNMAETVDISEYRLRSVCPICGGFFSLSIFHIGTHCTPAGCIKKPGRSMKAALERDKLNAR